jgi:hypothetical protein
VLSDFRPFWLIYTSIAIFLGLLLDSAQIQRAADRGELSLTVELLIAVGSLLLAVGRSFRRSGPSAAAWSDGRSDSRGFSRRDVTRLIAVLYWAALAVAYLRQAGGGPFTVWLVASVSYACGAGIAAVIKELRAG